MIQRARCKSPYFLHHYSFWSYVLSTTWVKFKPFISVNTALIQLGSLPQSLSPGLHAANLTSLLSALHTYHQSDHSSTQIFPGHSLPCFKSFNDSPLTMKSSFTGQTRESQMTSTFPCLHPHHNSSQTTLAASQNICSLLCIQALVPAIPFTCNGFPSL